MDTIEMKRDARKVSCSKCKAIEDRKDKAMRYVNADKLIDQMIQQAGCAKCDNYGGVRCRACPWDDAIAIVDDFANNTEGVTKEERI